MNSSYVPAARDQVLSRTHSGTFTVLTIHSDEQTAVISLNSSNDVHRLAITTHSVPWSDLTLIPFLPVVGALVSIDRDTQTYEVLSIDTVKETAMLQVIGMQLEHVRVTPDPTGPIDWTQIRPYKQPL